MHKRASGKETARCTCLGAGKSDARQAADLVRLPRSVDRPTRHDGDALQTSAKRMLEEIVSLSSHVPELQTIMAWWKMLTATGGKSRHRRFDH